MTSVAMMCDTMVSGPRPCAVPTPCRDNGAQHTGAGEDNGIDYHKNRLRFTYGSTLLRSHDFHPHPYSTRHRSNPSAVGGAQAVRSEGALTDARIASAVCGTSFSSALNACAH
jgi:hypothetical protein